MQKAILKLRIAKKSGKTIAELFIEGKAKILENFDSTNFQVGTEYKVLFQEQYVEQQASKKRLTVFYQKQLIHDSRPELGAVDEFAESQQTHRAAQLNAQPHQHPGKETMAVTGTTRIEDHATTIPKEYTATAPYNFIPLNKKVVPAEINFKTKRPCDFNIYSAGRFTGWISLEIETSTPLYVRDALNKKEMDEANTARKKGEAYSNPNFFSPSGIPQIPGSSIRGMVRNFVEIVSFGKFGFHDENRTLYHRGMADLATSLRKKYNEGMAADISGAYTTKAMGGYLVRGENGNLAIRPAVETDGTTFFRVAEKVLLGKSFYPSAMAIKNTKGRYGPNKDYKFFSKKVIFKGQKPARHSHSKPLFYGKVTDIDIYPADDQIPDGWHSGYLICSGWMPGTKGTYGKHMHWVINIADQEAQLLPTKDNLEYSYLSDTNRDDSRWKNEMNLVEQLKSNPQGIPCFYVTDQTRGEVDAFGHTGFFRLAYQKGITDLIPPELKDDSLVDLAESIFGNVDSFSARVFFEDAFLDQNPAEALWKKIEYPHILSSPKPTTFQHYLVQRNEELSEHPKNLAHYDSTNTQIRGNKIYWHRATNNWVQKDKNQIRKFPKQYESNKMLPVKSNQRFVGKVRFENLSDVELGALLFALDLPKGCCHKLGMGKPLGLGSVRLTTSLFFSDRKIRYSSLSAEWEKEIEPTEQLDKYKKVFERYILDKIDNSDKVSSLWEVTRMKELRVMLDFDNKPNNDETRYMMIDNPEIQDRKERNEFRRRKVLPKPSSVERPRKP